MLNTRRYLVELFSAIALYAVLLVGMNMVEPEGAARIALSLTPMLGAVAALVAIMRGIRQMDEMQRRIQFEAIAFAFAATALITFGWGFVENDGVPRLRAFAVWPIMGTCWALGAAIAFRRYR